MLHALRNVVISLRLFISRPRQSGCARVDFNVEGRGTPTPSGSSIIRAYEYLLGRRC